MLLQIVNSYPISLIYSVSFQTPDDFMITFRKFRSHRMQLEVSSSSASSSDPLSFSTLFTL